MLGEQGFAIIYAHVSQLQLEAARAASVHGLHPAANTECTTCKGTGIVPQHGGLRQKTCYRCSGRGWIKAR
jgi:DnaJ-class molecular chaperone